MGLYDRDYMKQKSSRPSGKQSPDKIIIIVAIISFILGFIVGKII